MSKRGRRGFLDDAGTPDFVVRRVGVRPGPFHAKNSSRFLTAGERAYLRLAPLPPVLTVHQVVAPDGFVVEETLVLHEPVEVPS